MTAAIADLVRGGLGSLPGAYSQLSTVLARPAPRARDIANAVRLDPGLTMRLLKVVNSAAYNPPRPVETVSRAAQLVGTRELQKMALATSVIHMFRGIPEHLLNMRSFWTHSIAVGACAEIIGQRIRHPEREHLFVAGLLHDVGTLVVCLNQPAVARRVFIHAENSGHLPDAVEREILGVDHAQVGGALLRSWGLPAIYADVVERHHRPGPAGLYRHAVVASIVHVADIVCTGLQMGNSGERCVSPLDPAAWELCGITEHDLPDIVQLTERRLEHLTGGLL